MAVLFLLVASALGKEVLVFDEEFDDDLTRWSHVVTLSGNGNGEFQAYVDSRENSFTLDGHLVIRPIPSVDVYGREAMKSGVMDLRAMGCESECVKTATPQDVLPPVLSAKLKSKFAFTYGRLEVNAKLPQGLWEWPAIWLMPRDNAYGTWPASGEIDVMESRSNYGPGYIGPAGERLGNDEFLSTLHWGPAWNMNAWALTTNQTDWLRHNETYHDDFHIFGLYWSATELFTYLDTPDNVVMRWHEYGREPAFDQGSKGGFWSAATAKNPWAGEAINAPFDKPFYVILNLAIGGTAGGLKDTVHETGYWPNHIGGKPWLTYEAFPHTSFYNASATWLPSWREADFVIDSVKIWALTQPQQKKPLYFLLSSLAMLVVACLLVASRYLLRNKSRLVPELPYVVQLPRVVVA